MPVITNITQKSHICFFVKRFSKYCNTILKNLNLWQLFHGLGLETKYAAMPIDQHFSDTCWVIISLQVYVRSYFYNFQIFKKAYPTSSHNIFIFSQLMSVVVHDVQLLPLLNARGLLS